jgi:hypothetical protein
MTWRALIEQEMPIGMSWKRRPPNRRRLASARAAAAPSRATEVRSFAAAHVGSEVGERGNEGRRDATTN